MKQNADRKIYGFMRYAFSDGDFQNETNLNYLNRIKMIERI